jgi:hypothetical protein
VIAYKLLRRRKDGTLGPLFINRGQVIQPGRWLKARCYPTAGFAVRPGWHCTSSPEAPHLSPKGRVWAEVEIADYVPHVRPAAQGGLWFTANRMRVLQLLEEG